MAVHAQNPDTSPDIPYSPDAISQMVEIVSASQAGPSRGRKLIRVLAGFLFGQGASQGLNILAAIYLVHRLPVEAYAQFGLATAFQTVFSVFMDLGLASTIVPLVGERKDDAALIGRYVRAAKHLRDRLFLYLAPLATLGFFAVTWRHHWSLTVLIPLLASVLISLYSGGRLAYFSAPLYIFGNLRSYYAPLVITAAARIGVYAALATFGGLNAWSASAVAAFAITLNATLMQRASFRYLQWPQTDDPAADRELIDYILPALPAIVFSAFQSQISLFLISIFGGTRSMAEVTALSRIGQIFAVLMTFNTIVVEPYIARQPRAGLLRKFLALVAAATLGCVPAVLLAYFKPALYIWVVGSTYSDLRPLMGLYLLSSSLSFVTGSLWIMNRGRKWVFWSGSLTEILLLLVGQVAFLVVRGVHSTRDAVLFSLVSAVCVFLAHLYVSILGFSRNRSLA